MPMTEKQLAEWMVTTCLAFGTTVATAYQVAGLFVEAVRPEPATQSPVES